MWLGLVVLQALLGCARLDVREWLPSQTLDDVDAPPPGQVAVACSPLGELRGPPSMQNGAASLLPEPLASVVSQVPLLGTAGQSTTPAWFTRLRRQDVVTRGVVDALMGSNARDMERQSRWYALSDDSAALLDARQAGAKAVLVMRASVGPDDAAVPLPGALVVSAEAALLDTADGHTLARAYDRVSMPVRGLGEAAVTSTARRAASVLGRRLGALMRLRGWAWDPQQQDEE